MSQLNFLILISSTDIGTCYIGAQVVLKLLSLQCYSVLSTIAQVLRKMSLKILVS